MSGRFEKKDASLEEAKAWLRERFEDGAQCPCCDQRVQLYKRPLTSSMMYVLVELHRYFSGSHAEPWVHVGRYMSEKNVPEAIRGGDFAKMRFWGLIEEKPEIRDDGSPRAGYYRITDLGKRFVRGEVRVPAYVFLYNEKPVKREVTETVSIQEALGKKFNYRELMNGLL